MVNQQIGQEPPFEASSSDDGDVDNLDFSGQVQMVSEKKTIMAEAQVSEINHEDAGRRFLLDVDENRFISSDKGKEDNFDRSELQKIQSSSQKSEKKLEVLEKKLNLIEKLLEENYLEQDLQSHYDAELAASAVEENLADDWYSENPNWYKEMDTSQDE